MKKKTTEEPMDEAQILARLSERVDKAVQMIQELRRERDELKARLEEAQAFGGQRQEIRQRIESILLTLERLEE